MPNNEYWRKRQETLQISLFEPAEGYIRETDRDYARVIREIECEVALWYRRFVSEGEADSIKFGRMLNRSELKEFREKVTRYIKGTKENKWVMELEKTVRKLRISRFESLMLEIRDIIEIMYGSRSERLDKILKEVYTRSVYENACEIFLSSGRERPFDQVEENKEIVKRPWTADGKNFYQRLLKNKARLIREIRREFEVAFAVGLSEQRVIDNVTKKLKVDRLRWNRLVVTEVAYFAARGRWDCYKSLDVKKYMVLGTLHYSSCNICRDYNGRVLPVSAMKIGLNAPPFHPNCRCTTIACFEDEKDDVE